MKTQSSLPEPIPGDDLSNDLRPEYSRADLKDGVRGKYLAQHRSGKNLVLLDADVARIYPTAEAVNAALRRLMQLREASPISN